MKKLFVLLALIALIFSDPCEECEDICKHKYNDNKVKVKDCIMNECIMKGIC